MSEQHDLELARRIAALEHKVSEIYRRLGQAEPAARSFGDDEFGFASAPADEPDPRIVELIREGKKIHAVKLYRELSGLGLKEAKDEVDRIEQLHRPLG